MKEVPLLLVSAAKPLAGNTIIRSDNSLFRRCAPIQYQSINPHYTTNTCKELRARLLQTEL
jgi:hypothetical protein